MGKKERWERIAEIATLKADMARAKEATAKQVLQASIDARQKILDCLHLTSVGSRVGETLNTTSIRNINALAGSLTKTLHADTQRHEQKVHQHQRQTEQRQKEELREKGIGQRLQQVSLEDDQLKTKRDDQSVTDAYRPK